VRPEGVTDALACPGDGVPSGGEWLLGVVQVSLRFLGEARADRAHALWSDIDPAHRFLYSADLCLVASRRPAIVSTASTDVSTPRWPA
jgi:hypothetical protein